MRSIRTDEELAFLESRVLHHARAFGRTLPEMRFFILEGLEFTSLLEKGVYPASPVNIWEGKRMVTRKYRIKEGLETSLYYEVVQTGNPSYAYLNADNNAMTQASVMAHVVGHCEFSELNVLRDSNTDRTEFVMHLVRKVNMSRSQMGDKYYKSYWNAVESAIPLLSPNSQYNLKNSVDTDIAYTSGFQKEKDAEAKARNKVWQPVFSTLNEMLRPPAAKDVFEEEQRTRARQETLSRVGYKLKAPCQDVLGFLRNFAPTSHAERAILDYMYVVHKPQDFVIRTQIMNEGWAMYWEKKIMLELFKERACKGIIEYAKVFSGVCYPRPYYMRNPYHLGFHMWNHVENLYKEGKVSLDFVEETDQEKKDRWNKGEGINPTERMVNIVRTCTDYEFLRRFLTTELIENFHLNRIPQRDMLRLGISKRDVIREDRYWVWLNPEPIKPQMLNFFTHYYRPRIYVIDSDFEDGGLLLFHRDDGRRLRSNWIRPTLRNINTIWKGAVSLVSKGNLHTYAAGRYRETRIPDVQFEEMVERIQEGKKPLVLE